MSDVLADKFTVVVDEQSYEFRIPSIKYDIESGYRAADIRRRAFPESQGALGAVDFNAVQFSRACAYLELYLVGSSTLWPYGFADDADVSKINAANPPKVDFEKFPVSAAETVLEVGYAFEQQYAQFRRPRHRRAEPVSPEAVVGVKDSGP
jgi:hypothetical protein